MNTQCISVDPVPIEWNPEMSIYASEAFLRNAGDEYGWLAGRDEDGGRKCILPYTVIRKAALRLVRFRVETIPVNGGLVINEEKLFLGKVVDYFRAKGADLILPATTNTIFRTYPEGASAVPYGSFVVDLTQPEDFLWDNLHSKHRNVIRNAMKQGVRVHEGVEHLDVAYELVRETLKRSGLGFASLDSLRKLARCLGNDLKVIIAEHNGALQGCAIIPFSRHSAYYLYGGSASSPVGGAMNLLQWEAMRTFKALGVKRYDFVGVRINPEKGSKQEGLMRFKERFGGQLVAGYMWRYPIRYLKFRLYCLAARLRSGGDIVDQELRRMRRGDRSVIL